MVCFVEAADKSGLKRSQKRAILQRVAYECRALFLLRGFWCRTVLELPGKAGLILLRQLRRKLVLTIDANSDGLKK
jgi:hypothetical protein